MDKLTAVEIRRYAACKKQIAEGLQTCFDTGMALTEIRDSKLYREEFDTFAEFCQQTYQLGKTHAYRLIESAEIKMSPIGDKIQNEAQARAIAQVPEKDRLKVIRIAEKSGDVTAAAISEAAAIIEVGKPIGRDIITDKIGYPIPHALVPLWRRSQEAQDVLTSISRIRGILREAQEKKDPLWREVNFSGALADLGRAYTALEAGKPYAVCPDCQGRVADRCAGCRGRGFISEFRWNNTTTKEAKELRRRMLEKAK